METQTITGYSYGEETLQKSPVSLNDLDLLKNTVLFSKDDERYLRMAGDVLEDQVEDILDLWYNYIGSNDHLLSYFGMQGKPDQHYLDAVRSRFGQWITDLCRRKHNQEWLDYQIEFILTRHLICNA